MTEAVIIILLIAVIAFSAYKTVTKLRKGGGCCGEHEQAEKSVTVKDRNKQNYPYSAELKISGMTCSNCAKRVENALNSTEGIWARVDLNSNTAHIRMKHETDVRMLCGIVAGAGYMAEEK